MIKFKQTGDFSKITSYLKKQKKHDKWSMLDKYGQLGVDALRGATPKDTGKTASSWYYTTEVTNDSVSITWNNRNVNNGVPIAIILQYGHGTGTGGWVEGRDYINPTMAPIFDQIAEALWKEISKA